MAGAPQNGEGRIKKWFMDKGFGFIQSDLSEHDIFVHFSVITNPNRKNLNINEAVTFETEVDQNTGKLRATTCTGDGSGSAYNGGSRQGQGGGNNSFQSNSTKSFNPSAAYGNAYGGGFQQQPAASFGSSFSQYPQQYPQQSAYGNQFSASQQYQQYASSQQQQPSSTFNPSTYN